MNRRKKKISSYFKEKIEALEKGDELVDERGRTSLFTNETGY